MTPSDALQEFKIIIQEDYGLTLDDTEATKLARDYLVVLETVLTPPKEQLTKPVKEEQNED